MSTVQSKIVYDRTRDFSVLYGAVQYGIFSGCTCTHTAVRHTFSILPIFSESRHFIVYVNLDWRQYFVIGKMARKTRFLSYAIQIGKCDPKPKEALYVKH